MTTTLFPATWILALSARLQRLLGIQQPSSDGPDQAQTSQEHTADHDDEWGDWVIPTPECEEQVEDFPVLFGQPVVDEIFDWEMTFEHLMAFKRVTARNAWIQVGGKDRKPSDGENEENPFHLEDIPAGIRMPPHTPPDSENAYAIGTWVLDLDGSEWWRS